jgi:hypothetical protein
MALFGSHAKSRRRQWNFGFLWFLAWNRRFMPINDDKNLILASFRYFGLNRQAAKDAKRHWLRFVIFWY